MKRLSIFFLLVLVPGFLAQAKITPMQESAVEKPAFLLESERGQREFTFHQLTALMAAQQQYQLIVKQGGWPHFPSGPTLRPGESDVRVSVLRAILLRTGDYAGGKEDANLYDEPLAAAMRRFQQRHGLEPDGVIGAGSAKALQVTAETRLKQLELNAQRLREFISVQEPDERAILVNIPAFTLFTLESGALTGHMRAIVGRPSRATPRMTSYVSAVNFNPAWNVPSSIANKDLLPKLRKNPALIDQLGYSLTRNGQPVDAAGIDWANDNLNGIHIRQRPGEDNALGRIKFTIPNDDAIYLHSTSSPRLFSKAGRGLSSGCVRVEDPRRLAHFILDADYPPKTVNDYYDSSASRALTVQSDVPVYLVYWTAAAGPDGELYFYDDLYGLDKQEPITSF